MEVPSQPLPAGFTSRPPTVDDAEAGGVPEAPAGAVAAAEEAASGVGAAGAAGAAASVPVASAPGTAPPAFRFGGSMIIS